jgi:iron complex transport system permease protein
MHRLVLALSVACVAAAGCGRFGNEKAATTRATRAVVISQAYSEIVLSINVAIVAASTAFTGVIGFVGLIVPHILRMLRGADNRFLIVASAILGGTLLSVADLVARVTLRPAELPIGIVTSVVGVPVFLGLLRRRKYVF